MVQVLQPREKQPRKSFGESILGGFVGALPGAIQKYQEMSQDLGDAQADNMNFETVKRTFGDKFANIWRAAPVGGKTELLKTGIDALQRGNNLEEMLSGFQPPSQPSNPQQNTPEIPIEQPEIPQMKNGKLPKDFNWPDFKKSPRGTTPKEWNEQKQNWRKENAPIFQENKTRLKANARDQLGVKKLQKLSPKMPEGMERILINPETQEFYGLAQLAKLASPEVQEWVKEIARFQNRAKDAYGSRVTNFDLQQYMKQFPGLLNTREGRERILKMMETNLKLDNLYDTALEKVYQKYGLAGIPQEESDRLAQEFIKDETESLHQQYLGLDQENSMFEEQPQEKKLSGKIIDVIGPDGQEYEIDQSEVEQLPPGFKII